VDNEPGVLARVIGLFSGRSYNIESLTVSETEQEQAPVAHHGCDAWHTPCRQLDAISLNGSPVHRVIDLHVRTRELGQDRPIERELACG